MKDKGNLNIALRPKDNGKKESEMEKKKGNEDIYDSIPCIGKWTTQKTTSESLHFHVW